MRTGLAWVALQGGLGAALLLWLARRGEAPSGPLLLPIPRENYYAVEAAFVLPVRLAMASAFALAAHGSAKRLGGAGSLAETFDRGASALALPFLLLWWLPDVLLYATGGFEALTRAVRVLAPLSSLASLALAMRAIRGAHGLSLGRTSLCALAGWVAQALVGAPFLR
jgi:hypothetical protein